MYISTRKEKQDEGKLFLELYMYNYLTSNPSISVFELNKIAKRSVRTYQRYAKELESAGCSHVFFDKTVVPAFYGKQPEKRGYGDLLPPATDISNTSDQHIIKLNRLFKALDYYSTPLWNYYYEEDEDALKVITYHDYKMHICSSISQKTYERDIKMLKAVIKLYVSQLDE